MHVSRNKCELLAECCITGVAPKDIVRPNRATLKGVDISKILLIYEYLQIFCILSVEDFERITQMFYTLLNNGGEECYFTNNSLIAEIGLLAVAADDELVKIKKNRELEEEIAYV